MMSNPDVMALWGLRPPQPSEGVSGQQADPRAGLFGVALLCSIAPQRAPGPQTTSASHRWGYGSAAAQMFSFRQEKLPPPPFAIV